MKKAKLSPRNYLVTAALAGAALAYVFLVFLPAQASITEMRTEIEQKRQYIAESDRLVFTIDQNRQRLLKVHEFNAAWEEHAPAAGQLSPVLADISQAAADAGVTMLRLEPQPSQPYEVVSRAGILLICEGEFAGLMQFIHSIESHPATLSIESMDLSTREADTLADNAAGAGASMQASLNLAVFTNKAGSSD